MTFGRFSGARRIVSGRFAHAVWVRGARFLGAILMAESDPQT